MGWYWYIALLLIIPQVFVFWFTWRNFRYTFLKPWEHRGVFEPKVLLTIPCKGIDLAFKKNISSFINQDYDNFIINFVVDSESDPAYKVLLELTNKLRPQSKASQITIFVSGKTTKCSQKIHNMLHSYNNRPDGVAVLAFADSDVCVHSRWLYDMTRPLKQSRCGVSTGYRWFVPEKFNLATIVLSICNGKVAQYLGRYYFNQAWGGSMAITVENFRELEIAEIWPNVVSDDYSLSYAVKEAHKKVVFVPSCMVASYEKTTWLKLFEFARRQFLITRVSAPRTWLFALIGSLYSVAGFWGSLAASIYAISIGAGLQGLAFALVSITFWEGYIYKAVLRHLTVAHLLPGQAADKMKIVTAADILAGPIYPIIFLIFVLSSAIGRTITWRGIKYKLISPTKTEILQF